MVWSSRLLPLVPLYFDYGKIEDAVYVPLFFSLADRLWTISLYSNRLIVLCSAGPLNASIQWAPARSTTYPENYVRHQGMGILERLSDSIGAWHCKEGIDQSVAIYVDFLLGFHTCILLYCCGVSIP